MGEDVRGTVGLLLALAAGVLGPETAFGFHLDLYDDWMRAIHTRSIDITYFKQKYLEDPSF